MHSQAQGLGRRDPGIMFQGVARYWYQQFLANVIEEKYSFAWYLLFLLPNDRCKSLCKKKKKVIYIYILYIYIYKRIPCSKALLCTARDCGGVLGTIFSSLSKKAHFSISDLPFGFMMRCPTNALCTYQYFVFLVGLRSDTELLILK